MGHRFHGRRERFRSYLRREVRGFTLLEIMMVVGIIGIILAMGLPSVVRSLEREPLRQAVTDMIEALNTARAQAILRGRCVQVTVNADNQVSVAPAPGRSAQRSIPRDGEPILGSETELAEAEAEGGGAIFSASFAGNVGITSLRLNQGEDLLTSQEQLSEVRVRFFANGTADDFEIELTDETGIRHIELDPITGLSEVTLIQ